MEIPMKNTKMERKIMKLKDKMSTISFGHLKSEKAVDRHFFLKSDLDDSLLQILATLHLEDEFKSLNISRLLNLFVMKGIWEFGEMELDDFFKTISELNADFMEA
ncbi:hypothetical protein [Methanobrevibacter sp.]|uniref:hypothetical protein n=1 Tax=Methanobrevibacter sp. TaxID=66852 RepID=UPI00386B6D9A